MSAYGPAIVATPSSDEAHGRLRDVFERTKTLCKQDGIVDDQQQPAAPAVQDEDDDAWTIVFYESYAYGEMPDEVRADEDSAWKAVGERLIAALRKEFGEDFQFEAYFVEC